MRITVRVIPRAKKELIKEENNLLKVYVTAPPEDGRANRAVIELLSEHFKVKRNCITILSGKKSRTKIIQIL